MTTRDDEDHAAGLPAAHLEAFAAGRAHATPEQGAAMAREILAARTRAPGAAASSDALQRMTTRALNAEQEAAQWFTAAGALREQLAFAEEEAARARSLPCYPGEAVRIGDDVEHVLACHEHHAVLRSGEYVYFREHGKRWVNVGPSELPPDEPITSEG